MVRLSFIYNSTIGRSIQIVLRTFDLVVIRFRPLPLGPTRNCETGASARSRPDHRRLDRKLKAPKRGKRSGSPVTGNCDSVYQSVASALAVCEKRRLASITLGTRDGVRLVLYLMHKISWLGGSALQTSCRLAYDPFIGDFGANVGRRNFCCPRWPTLWRA